MLILPTKWVETLVCLSVKYNHLQKCNFLFLSVSSISLTFLLGAWVDTGLWRQENGNSGKNMITRRYICIHYSPFRFPFFFNSTLWFQFFQYLSPPFRNDRQLSSPSLSITPFQPDISVNNLCYLSNGRKKILGVVTGSGNIHFLSVGVVAVRQVWYTSKQLFASVSEDRRKYLPSPRFIPL